MLSECVFPNPIKDYNSRLFLYVSFNKMHLDRLRHCRAFRSLVREGGLEPPLSFENRILNPARLPIPPLPPPNKNSALCYKLALPNMALSTTS